MEGILYCLSDGLVARILSRNLELEPDLMMKVLFFSSDELFYAEGPFAARNVYFLRHTFWGETTCDPICM